MELRAPLNSKGGFGCQVHCVLECGGTTTTQADETHSHTPERNARNDDGSDATERRAKTPDDGDDDDARIINTNSDNLKERPDGPH